MSEPQYFASDADVTEEHDRLGLLEALLDPLTIRRLEAIGPKQGWRCLCVAAGRGAVATWLAHRVGSAGHVVATDLDTRLLRDLDIPNVEVRQHDIVSDGLETERFDLVHCRCLLMHVRQPTHVLERMVSALRPGGWLLVEEPDDTGACPVDNTYPGAERIERANRAVLCELRDRGVMDPFIGCRLLGLVERLGLEQIHCEGVTWLHRGGDAAAQAMSATVPLHERAGLYSPADAEAVRLALQDPNYRFLDSTWFGAQGRRSE